VRKQISKQKDKDTQPNTTKKVKLSLHVSYLSLCRKSNIVRHRTIRQ